MAAMKKRLLVEGLRVLAYLCRVFKRKASKPQLSWISAEKGID